MGLVAVLNRGLRKRRESTSSSCRRMTCFGPRTSRRCSQPCYRAECRICLQCDGVFGARSGVFPARSFSPALLLAGNYINATALTRRADALAVGGFHPNPRTHRRTGTSVFACSGREIRSLPSRSHFSAIGSMGLDSRNPRRAQGSPSVACRRAAHPGLTEGARGSFARLCFCGACDRSACAVACAWLLDRAWGFPPPSSVRPARPQAELRGPPLVVPKCPHQAMPRRAGAPRSAPLPPPPRRAALQRLLGANSRVLGPRSPCNRSKSLRS